MHHHRETLHLFDLMFKYILKEVSPQAVVHFINGLFNTQYSVESPVRFAATESVQQEAEHLETISSDMILRVGA
ncbi:MAG: hypothetical protein LBB80_10005, partial [Treponema sp.]|nr:hypothetical protein [Treponema sp.]